MDYINIGSSPCDEHCVQVGAADYHDKARAECIAFKHQIIRACGEPPEGARLAVKSFPHDFGSYLEVVVYFEEDNRKAIDYAFNLESNSPANWDDEAKVELLKPRQCSL